MKLSDKKSSIISITDIIEQKVRKQKQLEEYDIVILSRYVDGGKDLRSRPRIISSQIINDSGLEKLGIKPRAKIVALALAGDDPVIMLTGPIPASKNVLNKAKLSIEDIDLYEVNEAFAPVPIAWAHELGADLDKLNVNGGAMALGHPLGGTGAKLMTTLLHELERREARYGLQSICEGGGTANAMIIERLS